MAAKRQPGSDGAGQQCGSGGDFLNHSCALLCTSSSDVLAQGQPEAKAEQDTERRSQPQATSSPPLAACEVLL